MRIEYLNTYYNPDWVYSKIKDFFDLDEFFDTTVIAWMQKKYPSDYEDRMWGLIDFTLLSNILYIRINIDKAIYINQPNNKDKDERGVRVNLSAMIKAATKLGKYILSGHVFAKAVDFDVKGMIAEDVRDWIFGQGENMPYKCRLEWKMDGKPIPWVHMDTIYQSLKPHVYKFNI